MRETALLCDRCEIDSGQTGGRDLLEQLRAERDVQPDADDDARRPGRLRTQLDENASELAIADEHVVGPLEPRVRHAEGCRARSTHTPMARPNAPASRGISGNVQLSDRHTAPPGGASHVRPRRPRPAD